MTAKKLYVVADFKGAAVEYAAHYAVTEIGERVFIRLLTADLKPRAFASTRGASVILNRARAQFDHDLSDANWRIVDAAELRTLQGKPPIKKKITADVPRTHADHIHRTDKGNQ